MMTQPLSVGQIALSFHAAAAAIVIELLEQLGHTIELHDAPHADMFAMQQAGKVDLVVSAWLPDSHEVYVKPYVNELEKLAVIYEPYCIWGVSDSAPDSIQSVSDLAKPEVAAQFRKLIQGIAPGAGISRFSRAMVDDYDLAAQGFHFENGTLDDCAQAYMDATAAGDLAIVPLWHPQWLHTEYKLRALKDPKGMLGGQDDATLVLRKDAMSKVSPQGLSMLRKIYLGNAVVSELDALICRQGYRPRDAANHWIKNNPTRVQEWLA